MGVHIWDSFIRKGINGGFLKYISVHVWSIKISSEIKLQNDLTEFFECKICTRQGCVSSPKIFALFINDLINLLKIECSNGIFVNDNIDDMLSLLFADDIATVSDTIIGLQKQLTVIE